MTKLISLAGWISPNLASSTRKMSAKLVFGLRRSWRKIPQVPYLKHFCCLFIPGFIGPNLASSLLFQGSCIVILLPLLASTGGCGALRKDLRSHGLIQASGFSSCAFLLNSPVCMFPHMKSFSWKFWRL